MATKMEQLEAGFAYLGLLYSSVLSGGAPGENLSEAFAVEDILDEQFLDLVSPEEFSEWLKPILVEGGFIEADEDE